MSLFKCQKCGCKENTACCNFHMASYEDKEALCSECDPEIGEWHGKFEKKGIQYKEGSGNEHMAYFLDWMVNKVLDCYDLNK